MLWNFILNIRLDDNVIYKKDFSEKEINILAGEKNLLDKNTIDCEILSNMEVK